MKRESDCPPIASGGGGRKSYVLLAATAFAVTVLMVSVFFRGSSQSAKTPPLDDALRGSSINSPAPTNPPVASKPKPVAAKTIGGYLEVGFDRLSGFPTGVTYERVNSNTPAFYYAPRLTNQIPDAIKALENKEVALKGFMLPLRGQEGRVQEFILLKNQGMCCFGRPPNVNEWVRVHMAGKGVKPLMDQIVTVYGRLHVGEYQENRQMLGIYRMDGDGMAVPAEF